MKNGIAAVIVSFLFIACGAGFAAEDRPLVLVSPGPLALSAVGMAESGSVRVELWKTQEEAVSRLIAGDAAAVVLPTPLGARLAEKADVVLLGVLRQRLFYLLSRDADTDLKKLKGGSILVAQGRGTMLDSILRSVLLDAGLEPDRDVQLSYAPAPEAAALYKEGKVTAAALPEPFATLAAGGAPALDLQALWIAGTSGVLPDLPGAGLFCLRPFVQDRPQEAALLVRGLEESVARYTEDQEKTCDRVEELFGFKAAIFKNALPRLKIGFESAQNASADVGALLERLRVGLPDAPAAPGAAFYYDASGAAR